MGRGNKNKKTLGTLFVRISSYSQVWNIRFIKIIQFDCCLFLIIVLRMEYIIIYGK